jgi:hypothetical protein
MAEDANARLGALLASARLWVDAHPGLDPAAEADWMTDAELEAELAREYRELNPRASAAEVLVEVDEHLESLREQGIR